MAEILVRAKTHWKDAWKQADINKLSAAEKEQYDARTQLGDIVVVRPDGWVWGSAECLPDFVIVKIPDMTVEEAKQYENSINELYTDAQGHEQIRLLRFREWRVPSNWMSTIISQGGIFTISKVQVTTYIERKIL